MVSYLPNIILSPQALKKMISSTFKITSFSFSDEPVGGNHLLHVIEVREVFLSLSDGMRSNSFEITGRYPYGGKYW